MRPGDHPGALLVCGAGLLGALSLLAPWALAFDPQAWLVWGRELPAAGLRTANGPSWKPLPVLVTVVLGAAGGGAPALWLVLARTASLLAVAGAWRLGTFLGGRPAGAAAAGVIVLSPWLLYNGALGNSEGMLAAAVLWAIVLALDGRPRAALACVTVAALLRPEIWPFAGAFGVRLAWRGTPADRSLAAGCALLVALAWLGPDVLWGDGALAARQAARQAASPGSAANDAHPALRVLLDAAGLLGVPALLLAALGARSGRAARILAAGALGYVTLVVLATLGGYAGNPRYLVPAVAVLAVLAGAGAARGRVPLVLALVAATAAVHAGDLRTAARDVGQRAATRRGLDAVVTAAGGERAVRACGPVRTTHVARALVALRLHVALPEVTRPPARRGATLLPPPPTILQAQTPVPARGPPGQALVLRAGGWSLWSSCAGQAAARRSSSP